MSGLVAMLVFMSVRAADVQSAADVTPDEVIHSLGDTFGAHPGQRKNHTKGTCAAGDFVATAEAAHLSRSQLFSGLRVPAIVRFSVAGGNPNAADTTKNARGMAIEFRLPKGSLQHMTMLNTPIFGAANPRTFNDMIVAARPDPQTGKPNPENLREFLASHPDALAQSNFLTANNPPPSYASSAFYSIHTFKFIDVGGRTHPVKWRFIPRDGERRLTDSEMIAAPKDFLEQRLIERVSRGPARWDMIVYEGMPGDPEDDATLAWPDTRKHVNVGTLSITQAMAQSGAECEKINFDPLVMADGIAPTNDPILLFRSPAYAISFARRLSDQ
jgi:catalase